MTTINFKIDTKLKNDFFKKTENVKGGASIVLRELIMLYLKLDCDTQQTTIKARDFAKLIQGDL